MKKATTNLTEAGEATISERDLKNHTVRILRQVEKGKKFLITVSGRVVAEVAPATHRSTWVPRFVVESIIRQTPLDPQFTADVDAVMGERIDAL